MGNRALVRPAAHPVELQESGSASGHPQQLQRGCQHYAGQDRLRVRKQAERVLKLGPVSISGRGKTVVQSLQLCAAHTHVCARPAMWWGVGAERAARVAEREGG